MSTIAFPNETAGYRAAREDLLEQEKELRSKVAAVAAARAALPPGGLVREDYVFERAGSDGAPEPVHFSELFAPGKDSLVVYSFMFGPERTSPCAGCTSLLDPLDGATPHIVQRVNFAVVAGSPVERLQAFAREHGWPHLPLLSTAGNAFNRDYHGETESGSNVPMCNVFHRYEDGIRHFWGAELLFAESEPGQDARSNDQFDPIWHIFDLTPGGRGTDWDPQVSYESEARL